MKSIEVSKEIRKVILDKAHNCGQSVHLGGALSMVDLLAVLYSEHLNFDPKKPMLPERDIFILSKGHTVLGYLATLYYYGYFDQSTFDTFQVNGSKFIAHPIKNLTVGIESSNGSLGQGISYAAGMALGYKKRNLDNRVYVMLGDGECNEGSVWEAAQFSTEFELNNLVAVIDVNGFRNDGETAYKKGLNLAQMWRAFGWNVIEIDGHNHEQINSAFEAAKTEAYKPTAIVAKTIKGKGVGLMEGNNDWHHNRITAKTYEQIVSQLGENNAN